MKIGDIEIGSGKVDCQTIKRKNAKEFSKK